MTENEKIYINHKSHRSNITKQLNEQMMRACEISGDTRRRIAQIERHLNYILSPIFVDIKSYYTYRNIRKYHEEKHLKSGKFNRKAFH